MPTGAEVAFVDAVLAATRVEVQRSRGYGGVEGVDGCTVIGVLTFSTGAGALAHLVRVPMAGPCPG